MQFPPPTLAEEINLSLNGLSYTLTETQNSSGDNVITVYNVQNSENTLEYADEYGSTQTYTYTTKEITDEPTHYSVNLRQTEYGSGDSEKYFQWIKDEDSGNYVFSTTDKSSAEITAKYSTDNQSSTLTSFSGNDINYNFIENTPTGNYGAAIRNNKQNIGNITGNFIGNAISPSSYANGGAIYNYASSSTAIIGNITGDFIGNYANSSSSYADGGAIYNYASGGTATIGNITGNFIGNYANSSSRYAYGGAIYNYASSGTATIGNITGDFIGNYASSSGTSYANGGAIYNYSYGTIGDIKGDFIGNYASSSSSYAYGGAIYNYTNNSSATATIGDITGDFIGNYASSSGTFAVGGAISNYASRTSSTATIGDIKGDFIGNYASSSGTAGADGGAIYNYVSSSSATATIGNITGDFIGNYASSSSSYAYGGAIYNYTNNSSATATIGDITGDFIGNYASSSSSYAYGGAIYNYANNSSSTATIGDIKGDFIGNYASGSAQAYGGAIYNTGTIGSVQGGIVNSSFYNNYAKSDNSNALGGAVYTTKDLNIISNDGYTTVISGNYTNSSGTVEDNAIYVANSTAALTFDLENNGALVLNDNINGEEGYTLNFTGDSTGASYINNDIINANIVNEEVTTNIIQGAYLNNNNSLEMNSGNINIANMDLTPIQFRNFDLVGGSINIASVDVDLANKEMGRFTADTYTNVGTGEITIAAMNLLSDAEDTAATTAVYFAQPDIKNNVATTSLTAYSPIYKYNVTYDNQNEYDGKGDGGYYLFSSPSSSAGTSGQNPSSDYNPAVLSTSVANQAAGQAVMNETLKYVFEHADSFTTLPSSERIAKIKGNYYAISTDYNDNLGGLAPEFRNEAVWLRPYVTLEKINLKNGPDVDSVTYGNLVGFDTDFIKLKGGWNSVLTGYIGYNGSQLRYSGVDTTFNGGVIGLTDTFYKKNFWTALTASVGAGVGQSYNMYGKEDFTTLLSGIASKTGYNFEFNAGRYIIQPIWNMSYTFVNTFDYTNSAGLKIDSKPVNTIQLNPSVRFIANYENGWQPYSSVGFVWNLMNESKVSANNIALPEMSIKPYVEYGLGVQKRFKDTFTAFGQAMVRSGGRKGIAFTFGLRWNLGKKDNSELVNLPKQKKYIKNSKQINLVSNSK